MPFFEDYARLFAGLTADSQVITANQRMSRFVLGQYDQWQIRQGQTAWPALKCQSLQLWIRQLWHFLQLSDQDGRSDVFILNAGQERSLWLSAIADCPNEYALLAPESMVEVVSQGWKNIRLWQKSAEQLEGSSEELALFKRWVASYQAFCLEHNGIDETELLQRVNTAVQEGLQIFDSKLVLLGFESLNPMETELLANLRQVGVTIERFELKLQSRCGRVALPDTLSEIRQAAAWAAELLRTQPDISVGIVIPDLANLRGDVEHIFTNVFEPQYILPHSPRHAPGFNISAAQPLGQTALIRTALLALKLNDMSLDRDDLSLLLKSPFLFAERELEQRLLLDTHLRAEFTTITKSALINSLSRIRQASAPSSNDELFCHDFYARLTEFHKCFAAATQKLKPHSQWAELFNQQLQILGWPGPRKLDTLEYQQLSHWPELIGQLATRDAVTKKVSWQQALSDLTHLTYTPFHPQTETSPVQILGLLEAAGQQYDYLWVLGLDDRVWPEPCKPNPLIPLALQKQWLMPRASSERELILAKQLTERLSQSAFQVIFSFPQLDADQPLRCSPLIAHFQELAAEEIPTFAAHDYYLNGSGPAFDVFDDVAAAAVTQPEQLRGGSQILKSQALCPFSAFAKHRLVVREPEEHQEGVTALMRGNLLHKSLELIWQQLQDQQTLLDYDEIALSALIEQANQQAWLTVRGHNQIAERIRDNELIRAARLIRVWLELEKTRPPFAVYQQEMTLQFNLGGIPLNIRYDRTDKLLGGDGLFVLDYKTGVVDIKSWFSERPEEPQVPLYCIALGDSVQAAAFGQLHAKDVLIKGICEEESIFPGFEVPEQLSKWDAPSQWRDLIQYWRHQLETLATAFIAGDARVDPKQGALTCRYCHLHSLCRIKSAQANSE